MKRLFKIKLQKTHLKLHHLFYVVFFVGYFVGLYLMLYHANGLNPFKLNIHYFSNVIASFSKRFLSDIAPYALIFYLLYYTKALWKRILLLILFFLVVLWNSLAVGFYFFTGTNAQLYNLEGLFRWNLLAALLTPSSAIAFTLTITFAFLIVIALFKIRHKPKEIWLFKILQKQTWSYGFLIVLLILAIGIPFIPIKYCTNPSLFATESLRKDFYRTVELENSALTLLIKELRFRFFLPEPIPYQFNEKEEAYIQTHHLDMQTIQNIPNPPKKIVLIVIESLDKEFLSYYNPKLPISTANLDQVFQEYPHIDEFYPSGPYTLHALGAMLCGHTNIDQTTKNPNHICIPEILADSGYKNEYIQGISKYYLKKPVHFDKFGFETIFAKEEMEEKFPEFKETHYKLYKGWGYTDNYVFNEAIERLKNTKPEDKLFLTLLTVDLHYPGGRCSYEKTEKDPEDPLLFSIDCLDRVFGEFMENLKKENLLNEDLVILLTSDQLYPGYSDILGKEFQTSFYLRPMRIPIIMLTKADLDLVPEQGSHVDIASTILDMANIDIPPYYMGKSLISSSYTTPMGQDRQNGYMIVADEIFFFSMDPGLTTEVSHIHLFSLDPEGQKEALGRLFYLCPKKQKIIDMQKLKEYEFELFQENTFYKWYYNKFYNLTND